MSTKNKKLISGVLIFSIVMPLVLFANPKDSRATGAPVPNPLAVPVGDNLVEYATGITAGSIIPNTASTVKTWLDIVWRQTLMAFAKALLQQMTQHVVDWINNGFHGNPLYLKNADSFFVDIAKYQIETAIDQFGRDPQKYPFGRNVSYNIIGSYKQPSGANMVSSWSSIIQDKATLYNYQTNFNYGGWDGFLINTQYPQNNYLGFEQLALGQINTSTQASTNKIQTLLQQGQGFLSPQTCQTNPKYNTNFNEFNPPRYDDQAYLTKNPYKPPFCDSSTPDLTPEPGNQYGCKAAAVYTLSYQDKQNLDKSEWSKPEKGNVCPTNPDGTSGLVSTTPGAVVANQIMTAMDSNWHQSELASAVGSSLSQIINALITQFINKGLASLSSSQNSTPPADTWDYEGMKLGVPSGTGTNDTFDWSQPDQTITVADLKQKVNDAIDKTNKELLIMTNNVPSDVGPGIVQVLGQIWPKIPVLDKCQPGPDLNWQSRLDQESQKNSAPFQQNLNSTDPMVSAQANLDIKELNSATDAFKSWLNTEIANALPDSSSYLDAINSLSSLAQQYADISNTIQSDKDVLASLQSIQTSLNDSKFATEPASGSVEEGDLAALYNQYNTMLAKIPSDTTIGQAQNTRNADIGKRDNLDSLITNCNSERKNNGWATPGGASSILSSKNASEQTIFCDAPIAGGKTHVPFINPNPTPAFNIPLVNAKSVPTGTSVTDISLNCSNIFNASASDYNNGLPGQ